MRLCICITCAQPYSGRPWANWLQTLVQASILRPPQAAQRDHALRDPFLKQSLVFEPLSLLTLLTTSL
eukprot:4754901-Amphidinium_carterae.1